MGCVEKDSTIAKKLESALADGLVETLFYRGEITLVVTKDSLLDVCSTLKNEEDFRMDFCADVVGVDYLGRTPRFEVLYHLYSIPHAVRVRVKVRLEEDETIPSVTSIWRSADWAEREIYDMYGIEFEGHPDMRRIYMPDDWEGYPLRKDYPLRGYKDEYNPNGEEKK